MKILIINDLRVTISDDTYFPFTHTISDLENVNIIGIPSTKSVTIPRCPQNDEIFGYIADITRQNYMYADDYYVGVSFSQIKKCVYFLYDDSILISKGNLIITNIDNQNYTVELYDELIDKLEQLEGNPDTNQGYLNNLDLIKTDGNVFEAYLYAQTITELTGTTYLVPTFNIKTYDTTGTDCFVSKIVTGSTNPVSTFATLPQELTPIQFNALKASEIDFAIPIKTVIDSINNKYNCITVDSDLNTLMDEVHLFSGKPYNIPTTTGSTIDGFIVSDTGYTMDSTLYKYIGYPYLENTPKSNVIQTSVANSILDNGKYEITLDVNLTFENNTKTINFISNYNGVNYDTSTPDGTKVGEIYLDFWLSCEYNFLYQGYQPWFTTPTSRVKIDLFKNVNYMVHLSGSTIDYCTLHMLLPISFDYNPKFTDMPAGHFYTKLNTDFSAMQWTPEYNTNTKLFYKQINQSAQYTGSYSIGMQVNESSYTKTTSTIKSGDLINGKNIFPKVSIKDFIINLAKFFNLGLSSINGKIHIHKKDYYVVNDTLLIDSITSVNSNNINFSKLVLYSNITSSDLVKDYSKYNNKKYGEQIINTGYSVKNNVKNVALDVTLPILLVDVNSYGYSSFCNYYNSNMNRYKLGVVEGLQDKLSFGYINNISGQTYVSDNTYYEDGYWSAYFGDGIETPKQLMTNLHIIYDVTGGTFTYDTTTLVYYMTKKINGYKTFSPYVFSGSTITKSLEVNKPVLNYANILDVDYPSGTTLYHRFHRNMLIDKYNSNTHLLTIKIYVDGLIDIYKIYNYQNSYYIISKIIEYDPTTPGIYDVELMRVNDITNYTTNIIL